jgi:hypothetical protein
MGTATGSPSRRAVTRRGAMAGDNGALRLQTVARIRFERSAWWRPSTILAAPDFERIDSDRAPS